MSIPNKWQNTAIKADYNQVLEDMESGSLEKPKAPFNKSAKG
ncbi:hypothetical protein [Pseudoalteromonas byunsanensis]|nr:hypothetical protein [Pseudoalteromonas byunsanensis]